MSESEAAAEARRWLRYASEDLGIAVLRRPNSACGGWYDRAAR